MSDTLVTNLDTSELKAIGAVHNEAELKQLLIDAKLADEEDRLLTIRQALKKYKPAVFWAMFLSVSCRKGSSSRSTKFKTDLLIVARRQLLLWR